MGLLEKLYQELDMLKRKNLASDVTYIISNAPYSNAPGSYFDLVSIRFPDSIEAQKIVEVKNYIQETYGKFGVPVEKVDLRSSHIIQIHIIKVGSPT